MSGNFNIPSNTHPVLNPDGTMNRVWYLYLTSLGGAAGSPSITSVSAETRPPALDAEISGTVPATENATEPQHGVGGIISIVEQVLQNYGLIP